MISAARKPESIASHSVSLLEMVVRVADHPKMVEAVIATVVVRAALLMGVAIAVGKEAHLAKAIRLQAGMRGTTRGVQIHQFGHLA
jgi:hypothetical protein